MNSENQTKFAVETFSLCLKRGEKLLFDKMNWQLPSGKFLAVTGASGSGKSSLLTCLSGNLDPTNGKFKLNVEDKKNVGLVFQNFRLTQNLSVLTNVLCGKLGDYSWWQTLFSFSAIERNKAFEILNKLGLEKLVHKNIRNISGGEQQRTAVARLLLQNPKIILADEPTSNLDMELAKKVLGLLKAQCQTNNATIITVLHDARLVELFADYELKIDAEFENGWNFQRIESN